MAYAQFPPEAYSPTVIIPLLDAVYKHGRAMTPQENLFLVSLKSQPTAVPLSVELLSTSTEPHVLQFAANLFSQSLSLTEKSDELLSHLVALIQRLMQSTSSPVLVKIRRQILCATGTVLRTRTDWKDVFHQLVISIQPDLFETVNPSPLCLDLFFVLSKFSGRIVADAPEMVFGYYLRLLSSQLERMHEVQAVYLKCLSDWCAEAGNNLGRPTETVGRLLVLIGKYIDCPKRENFSWSSINLEAASTLATILQFPDIHLLESSLIVLIRVIVAYPMASRMAQMTSAETQREYLETVAHIVLEFNLEHADVLVACSERPEMREMFLEYVRRMRILADPWPERWQISAREEACVKDAIRAFSEFLNLVQEMCGVSPEVSSQLLPELRPFFQILVKKVCQAPKAVRASWSAEDREERRQFQRDIQTTIEAFAAAIGQPLFEWFLQEFDATFSQLQQPHSHMKLAGLCYLLRFGFNDHVTEACLTSILTSLQRCLTIADQEVVGEAFQALSTWIGAVDSDNATCMQVLENILPICVAALDEKNGQLTGLVIGVVSAVVDNDPALIAPLYHHLSQSVLANVRGGVGSGKTKEELMSVLGQVMGTLECETIGGELDKVNGLFQEMADSKRDRLKAMANIGLFPSFFRSLAYGTAEQKPVHQSIARLSLQLLSYLDESGFLKWAERNVKWDDMFAQLVKQMLYAAASAAGSLLLVIVPYVRESFTTSQSPGNMRCIGELLTAYLSATDHADLFADLCLSTVNVVLDVSEKEDWMDYSAVYQPFVMGLYPALRSSPLLCSRLPLNWERLFAFVMKMLALPASGDAESQIKITVLFEELMRLKSPDGNPFRQLILTKYGPSLVQACLQVFCSVQSEKEQVKNFADCLTCLLMEIPAETRHWLQSAVAAVILSDQNQLLAFQKMISSLLTVRSKGFAGRLVTNYRDKFLVTPKAVAIF